MLYLLLALCGCLSGVTTLLFGFGGGFVAVPLLYLTLSRLGGAAAEVAMPVAVATSTLVMLAGALQATWRHARAGHLQWTVLRPLLPGIAVGAALGALLARQVAPEALRLAFIAYLLLTIADCLLRAGFLRQPVVGGQRVPARRDALLGLGIGTVASALGVGGSVMSVPLLRRRGLDMTRATAMASPLTLPVAVVGSLAWMLPLGSGVPRLGGAYLGYVNLPAFAVLAGSAWLGMRLATPWVGRLGDRWHARVYVGLLVLVLLGMLLG
ncbi:MAG: hypothetical protein GAK45_01816 [Pseudomonas citronellolis]|nr:MAG: hypothetical protein GAK45_01816 [Pseudomonas citronellolis]